MKATREEYREGDLTHEERLKKTVSALDNIQSLINDARATLAEGTILEFAAVVQTNPKGYTTAMSGTLGFQMSVIGTLFGELPIVAKLHMMRCIAEGLEGSL